MTPNDLANLANNQELLEIGRKAIEDVLIEYRDSRISLMGRNNGLIVAEKDGKRSGIIRLGPEDALRIGLRAIASHLAEKDFEMRASAVENKP